MGYLTNAPAPPLANLAGLDARYNGLFDKLSEGWMNPQTVDVDATQVAVIEFPITRRLIRIQGVAVPSIANTGDADLVCQVRNNGAWVTGSHYHLTSIYGEGTSATSGNTATTHARLAGIQMGQVPVQFEMQMHSGGFLGGNTTVPYYRATGSVFHRTQARQNFVGWSGRVDTSSTGHNAQLPIDRIRLYFSGTGTINFIGGTRIIFEEM